jgi:hypothetical protein
MKKKPCKNDQLVFTTNKWPTLFCSAPKESIGKKHLLLIGHLSEQNTAQISIFTPRIAQWFGV